MKYIRGYLTTVLLLFARFVPDRLKDRWIGGAAAGTGLVGLGAVQLLSALGITAVTHSSGAAILTGAGGYIAGTYGLAVLVALLTAPLTIVVFVACIVAGFISLVRKIGRKP